MISSKTVGFFSLIGGAAALIGFFAPKLLEKMIPAEYLIPIGAGIAAVIGLVALFSRNY